MHHKLNENNVRQHGVVSMSIYPFTARMQALVRIIQSFCVCVSDEPELCAHIVGLDNK